jgi:hypothetical protein
MTLAACAAPGVEIVPLDTDFALLEIDLRGWTWNEELLGLQQLFEGQFGPTPQIDLDRQIARARVPAPQPLDFVALRDGVLRNNVGVDRIVIALRAKVEDGHAVASESMQRWRIDEAPAIHQGHGWIWAEIREFDPPLRLRWLGVSSGPASRPESAPAAGSRR